MPNNRWVLVAEDNDDEFTIIERAFRDTNPSLDIRRGVNGQAALDILGEAEGQPLLVLLDVNMPVLTGLETLKKLRDNVETRYLPVVILTSSDVPKQVTQAYELGCSAYMMKPLDYDEFLLALQAMLTLWARFVSHP